MTGQSETSPTNSEAFKELESAMGSVGRPYARGSIVRNPSNPDLVVARGIQREMSVSTFEPFHIGGKLSVRAVMAEGEADDILHFSHNRERAVRWLFRSQLTFFVPSGRHTNKIPLGEHLAGAVYLLSDKAPEKMDEYFAADIRGDQATALSGHVEANRHHSLPSAQGIIINPEDDTPRTKILRNWFQELPQNDGMLMLSPTSAGYINSFELPQTINWLLKDPN
jgi:hypothetical protein